MKKQKNEKPIKSGFEVEKIVSTARVAKVVKGGRNFSFNAAMVVGDKNGVGVCQWQS